MWNGERTPPQGFLAELYGDFEEDKEEMEVEELGELDEPVEDDEENVPSSPEAPPFSLLTSPRSRARSRSRSPLVRPSSPPSPDQSNPLSVVIRLFDEDGVDLGELVTEGGRDDEAEAEDFLTADAHGLFVGMDMGESEGSPSLSSMSLSRDRAMRSGRGRARGGRRGRGGGQARRGRGVGGGRRRRAEAEPLVVGHPLEEVWVTDDDVPLELREMALDVVRRRRNEEDVRMGASESENGEYVDDIDGSSNSRFEWSPMETFQIREAIFTPERTGSVDTFSSPYDAFRSYWDESILQMIVEETNRYAPKIASPSFQAEWYSTNSHEILCLFAFWMMLGIIRMPTIESCFSTNYLLATGVFRHILTYRRYRNLARALNFIDSDPSYNAASTSTNDMASSDRIHYLRPIITHLNAKFQANYVPSQDICIDESLTLWKGRLNIKKYIRSKAAKFGIKTFELCESATGYLWSFIIYTGKQTDFTQLNSTGLKSTAIVKKLIAPLLNKGYRLFMDNWYNSPLLARFLKRNETECIGTLRSCRQDVPLIIKKAPLNQGQFVARHAGDLCILSWHDKKRINMISTCHGAAMGLATVPSRQPSRPLAFKPQVVLDYNRSMGGVDLKDQMLEPYLIERKRCAKWYMKLFKRLLNVSILNARILLQSSQHKPMDHLDFRLQLVDKIIEKHLPHCPKTRDSSSRHTSTTAPHHLNHTHWPVSIPPSASLQATNRKGRLSCFVCNSRNIRKATPYKCEACDVPLCVENCFREYHTR